MKKVILTESSLAELFQVTERLDAVVKQPGIVVGMTLQHIWHEDGNDKIYNLDEYIVVFFSQSP